MCDNPMSVVPLFFILAITRVCSKTLYSPVFVSILLFLVSNKLYIRNMFEGNYHHA